MDKYIIYCTEEQIKKAFDLGAPIEFERIPCNINGFLSYDNNLKILTVEQMIGWLEEKGIFIEINIHTPDRIHADWKKAIYTFSVVDRFMVIHKHGGYDDTTHYPSRKEASLAAINEALKYLSNNL